MKTSVMITSVILLNISLFSCTPQAIYEDGEETHACCGDDFDAPPTPSPPDSGG